MVLEGGVVGVDHGLGHHVGRGAHDVAAAHLVEDGLGELVADVALAHGARLGEGHLGGLAVVGARVGEGVVDHAHLGAVAVGHDDVDALGHHVHDVLRGVLHQLVLLLGGVAKGVAAKGYHHTRTFSFGVWHLFPPKTLCGGLGCDHEIVFRRPPHGRKEACRQTTFRDMYVVAGYLA